MRALRGYLRVLKFVALFGISMTAVVAEAQTASDKGRVQCNVLENGEPASGTFSLLLDGKEAHSGSCNEIATVPAGTYQAKIELDGVLDGPERSLTVTVKAGELATAAADFATGIIEVQIESKGRRAAGMAIINANGRQVGTLGSGVSAHLSVGTYQVIARYRSEEKQFGSVTIAPNRREVLKASFE